MLEKGRILQGRLHHYLLEYKLGEGGFGQVYFVQNLNDCQGYALKLGSNKMILWHEYCLLYALRDWPPAPRAYAWECFIINGKRLYGIVLEYREGWNLKQLLAVKAVLTKGETLHLACRIVLLLEEFHSLNYIYGDLKLEHIIYQEFFDRLSLVDYGSVCRKGSVIKSYTPLYDRKNRNKGTRLADSQYDIFAFSVILTKLQGDNLFLQNIIDNCFNQKYGSMTELLADLRKAYL